MAEISCAAVRRKQAIYFLPVVNLSDAAASGLLLEFSTTLTQKICLDVKTCAEESLNNTFDAVFLLDTVF